MSQQQQSSMSKQKNIPLLQRGQNLINPTLENLVIPNQQHQNCTPFQQQQNAMLFQQHQNSMPLQQNQNSMPLQQNKNSMPLQKYPITVPEQELLLQQQQQQYSVLEQRNLQQLQLMLHQQQLLASMSAQGVNPGMMMSMPMSMNPMQMSMNPMQMHMNPMLMGMNPMQMAMNPMQMAMNSMSMAMNPMQMTMNPMQMPMNMGWIPQMPYNLSTGETYPLKTGFSFNPNNEDSPVIFGTGQLTATTGGSLKPQIDLNSKVDIDQSSEKTSESEPGSESCSDDSDSDYGPSKEKRRYQPNVSVDGVADRLSNNHVEQSANDSSGLTEAKKEAVVDGRSLEKIQGGNLFEYQEMAEKYQEEKRKVNPIWKEVMDKQLVSEMDNAMQNVGVDNIDDGVADRGIENYITRIMRKRKLDENVKFDESSDVSSEGLSEASKNYIRERKKKFRKNEPSASKTVEDQSECFNVDLVETEVCAENGGMDTNDNSQVDPLTKTKDEGETSAQRSDSHVEQDVDKRVISLTRKERGSFTREKMQNMDDELLGHFLATKMRERNRELMIQAVKILGKELCIRLYFKMWKIERRGGLLIKNQSRRRTKGGVFLYLIRNDSRLPADKVEQIFQEETKRREEFKKKQHEDNERERCAKEGVDELQFRMHQRMAAKNIEIKQKSEEEVHPVCDIDDEAFSFSIDKLVHMKPGWSAQEGPVGNRMEVEYNDIKFMENKKDDEYDGDNEN